ncbi:MAG: WecB/TagA/CpsF family glycosyltransferase [Chloroflexi bacterium]|nr:WecB/TagA/CpsF family glycosyltransferase [Chloroflexota bacterium]
MRPDSSRPRLLIAQLADIGDLALTTPALAALREALPRAQIDLLAFDHALPVVPEDLVDAMIPLRRGASGGRAFYSPANLRAVLSLRRGWYDTLVIFHHFTLRAGVFKFWLIAKASGAKRIVGLKNENIGFLTDFIGDGGFGALHQAQYWLELVGLLGASRAPRPAQVSRAPLSDDTATIGDKPRVVLHTGSGGYSSARRWPAERFAAVAQGLRESHAAQIVLVGASEDAPGISDPQAENLLGRTALPQLADVIANADLFIGADSGVMHIAAATGTPVISIFGPSNADAWRPWTVGAQSVVLRSGVECSPCSYVGHAVGAREGCAARTCMKLVTTEQVLDVGRRLLDKRPVHEAERDHSSRRTRQDSRLRILGVPVDAITYKGWLEKIAVWIRDGGRARHVCTVNPEFIMIARKDPIFFAILQRAAICVPDGVGLLWASRRLGAPLPERVTGSDGVPFIALHAAERGWKLFFLGAGPGVADKAAAILQERCPGLIVAGTYGGSPAGSDEDRIVQLVNSSGADILFVAYGAPTQDKWIARNLPRLQVSMAMGVGGSLDFIAGVIPRAPDWMQRRGLEWLYRLLRQPWRWRRMLRLPRFVLAVLRQARP